MSDFLPNSTLAVADSLTAGQLLRQARETHGLHIAALAVSLKVPVKKLEALEADQFDLLPDSVFVRALASSVCRTLKVDPTLVLQRLPQSVVPKLNLQRDRINAPFQSPGDRPNQSAWMNVSRPAFLAGLVLICAALILIALPSIKAFVSNGKMNASPVLASLETAKQGIDEDLSVSAALNSTQSQAPALGASSTLIGVSLTAPNLTGDASAVKNITRSVPAISAASLPSTADVNGIVSTTAEYKAISIAEKKASGDVIFRSKGSSWVEVKDSKGFVVLRRTLNSGESVGASGPLPLSVIVGRAGDMNVEIRGAPFDLTGMSKNNVARFEVK